MLLIIIISFCGDAHHVCREPWVPGFERVILGKGQVTRIRKIRSRQQVVGNPEIFVQKNSVSRKRCRKVGAWPEINT